MRVMIVDDEFVSRNKLQKIMEPFGKCDLFEGGRESVDAFRKCHAEGEPYQLLLLDVSLPDMDGTQVLHEVRKIEKDREIPRENRVKVVMVTAHSDKDTIITSIQAGCDSFIRKPFDSELIFGKLEKLGFKVAEEKDKARGGSIRENVAQVIERFKRSEIDLPVLPKVVQEVDEILSRSDFTIDELSEVIGKDAVISAKLISNANSTLYNRGGVKIQSLKKAIKLMGFMETHAAVVAIASKCLYDTKNKKFIGLMEKLRLNSLASAHGAASIAKILGLKEAEKYFLMGLVHDIGNVVLIWTLSQLVPEDEPVDINDVISSIYEMHTIFGAALLQRWKFPEELVRVARMHEGPEFSKATEKDTLIVNLATNLAFKSGYGFVEREDDDLAGIQSAKLLDLGSDALEKLAKEIKELVEKSKSIF